MASVPKNEPTRVPDDESTREAKRLLQRTPEIPIEEEPNTTSEKRMEDSKYFTFFSELLRIIDCLYLVDEVLNSIEPIKKSNLKNLFAF